MLRVLSGHLRVSRQYVSTYSTAERIYVNTARWLIRQSLNVEALFKPASGALHFQCGKDSEDDDIQNVVMSWLLWR